MQQLQDNYTPVEKSFSARCGVFGDSLAANQKQAAVGNDRSSIWKLR
jgi:hypothetical protein